MLQSGHTVGRMVAVVLVLVLGIGAVAGLMAWRWGGAPPAAPATQVATGSTTSTPATRAAAARPLDYVQVIRSAYPQFPATQPLEVPLNLGDAAHLVLTEPIYVCPRGDLWITRPDAPPATALPGKASAEQIHFVHEIVTYVHWSLDADGNPVMYPVCRRADGAYDVLHGGGASPPAGHAAVPMGQSVVVERAGDRSDRRWRERVSVRTGTKGKLPPTHHGRRPRHYSAQHSALSTQHSVMALPDTRGVLAWAPWDNGRPGGRGATRFVEGRWVDLGPEQGWPERIIHLVPLLDGSVLQIIAAEDGKVRLALAALEDERIDTKRIEELVSDLSALEESKRSAARAQLGRYGPGLWPIVEKLIDEQPPGGRAALRDLLKDRIQPTLGGMTLIDGDDARAGAAPGRRRAVLHGGRRVDPARRAAGAVGRAGVDQHPPGPADPTAARRRWWRGCRRTRYRSRPLAMMSGW